MTITLNKSLSRLTVFNNPIIVVGVTTLLGALLRLYHLGARPMELDEGVLYWISKSGNLRDVIIQNIKGHSGPPLFVILLHFIEVFGDKEIILRSLPWFGGVAAIPAVYLLGIQFLEKKSAYLMALIVAISTTQINYSQQLREYSLVFLLAILMMVCFSIHLRKPSWTNSIILTFLMLLSISLQYGLALLIIALNIILIVDFIFVKDKQKLLKWVVSQFVVFFAVLVLYFFELRNQMVVGFGSSPTFDYLAHAYWDGSKESLFKLAILHTRDLVFFAFPGIMFVYALVIGIFCAMGNKSGRIALMMLIFPMAVTFFAACARLYPYLGARQDIFLTPMIYLFFGFGVDYLFSITQKKWVVSILVMFIVIAGISSTYEYLNKPFRENMRSIVSVLSSSFEKGDIIYVYYSAKPTFTYYYRDYPETTVFGISSRANPKAYFREIDGLLAKNKRIWMVFTHGYKDERDKIRNYVAKSRTVELVANHGGTYLFLVHQEEKSQTDVESNSTTLFNFIVADYPNYKLKDGQFYQP